VFAAVLADADELRALLADAPHLVHERMTVDVLVESIPHWLYVGDTPLHLAAAAERPSVARVLLEQGADPNAINRRGATPLHYACDPRPAGGGVWDPDAQREVIELLAQHGADVDRADRGGSTPLHRAVRARSPAAVRALLTAGARVEPRLRTRGSTPLHLTTHSTGAGGTAGASAARDEIVGLLVRHGALR